MSKELFNRGNDMVQARSGWEQKQRLYSQMRHDGLRRRNKPWPGAADLHFPLIDMNIRKAKPFWEAQATSSEKLAAFVSMQEQQAATTSAAAEFFDFELKQNSNFETELIRAIDFMLLRGRGVLKVSTDPFDSHRIICQGIDPLYILMAEGADDFEDADEFVHVQHFSVAKYKRDRRYKQDVIDRIKGNKDYDAAGGLLEDKEAREGVNYSRNPNQIILWEHWVKTMGGYTVNTYSPRDPDAEVRKPFGCPYKRRGKASVPFFSFKTEIKDGGWYSPRGLAELNAPFESYACKLWNEKTDAMTFGNRPVLTSDSPIANTTNIRWNPGEYVPGGLRQVPVQPPAFSFDQELNFTRGVSEQVSMLPDFGITQPGQPGEKGNPRTATENNRISNLQSVGTDSNGRIFRKDLAKVYWHTWALMLQFKRQELVFYVGGELKTLPEQALHDAYLIAPDGSPDQWNKQLRQQRADARLVKYANMPNVDFDPIVRDSLAADDPKLVQEAFIPTNVKAGSEAEDEAVEIMIMRQGFPAQVKPNEDHATRIHVLAGWLQKQALSGAPVDPIALQRVQGHMVAHFQYLEHTQPQVAQHVHQQVQQMEMQTAQALHQQVPPRRDAAPGEANPGSQAEPMPEGNPT